MGTLRRSYERVRAESGATWHQHSMFHLREWPSRVAFLLLLLTTSLATVVRADDDDASARPDGQGSGQSLFAPPQVPKKFLLPYAREKETDEEVSTPAVTNSAAAEQPSELEPPATQVVQSVYMRISDLQPEVAAPIVTISNEGPLAKVAKTHAAIFEDSDDFDADFAEGLRDADPSFGQDPVQAEPADKPIRLAKQNRPAIGQPRTSQLAKVAKTHTAIFEAPDDFDADFAEEVVEADPSLGQDPVQAEPADKPTRLAKQNRQADNRQRVNDERITALRVADQRSSDVQLLKRQLIIQRLWEQRLAAQPDTRNELSPDTRNELSPDTRNELSPDTQSEIAPDADGMDDAVSNQRNGGPFEFIDPVAKPIDVMTRHSVLLRTKYDVYRTAVVDSSICDIVQFTPREISLVGLEAGSTTVTFWFKNGKQQPLTCVVNVNPDDEFRRILEDEYEVLARILTELFPDSKVELLPVADKLIVRGQAKDAQEAAQILQIIQGQTGTTGGGNQFSGGQYGAGFRGNDPSIGGSAAAVLSPNETGRRTRSGLTLVNLLRVPGPQQIALKVKIAELNRSAARGFGVDVDAEINVSDTAGLFIQSMLNATSGGGSGAPSVISRMDGDDIEFGVRWLEQEGVIRMLSEPTLVTLSGRPATFVAGGEFAVPTAVGIGGIGAVTTDFRTFGAIISFLPVVIDKDYIRLEVSPEFSQINSALSNNNSFGLDVRSVTTTVEMREGQTLAIAGLLDDTMNGTKRGDLPILSHVFGRRDISRNETELIILVTPELIHPLDPEEVPPLPGFDVTEPTNHDFYLHGQLEGNPTQDFRNTIWPRLRRRYQGNGPAMTSGPFGHGQ